MCASGIRDKTGSGSRAASALSIATRIFLHPWFVETAGLDVLANSAAPIAARIAFRDIAGAGAGAATDLDFRPERPQICDTMMEPDAGALTLENGGVILAIDGGTASTAAGDIHGEYPGLHHRFAAIVPAGTSDVDVMPLRLVAATYLPTRHDSIETFIP